MERKWTMVLARVENRLRCWVCQIYCGGFPFQQDAQLSPNRTKPLSFPYVSTKSKLKRFGASWALSMDHVIVWYWYFGLACKYLQQLNFILHQTSRQKCSQYMFASIKCSELFTNCNGRMGTSVLLFVFISHLGTKCWFTGDYASYKFEFCTEQPVIGRDTCLGNVLCAFVPLSSSTGEFCSIQFMIEKLSNKKHASENFQAASLSWDPFFCCPILFAQSKKEGKWRRVGFCNFELDAFAFRLKRKRSSHCSISSVISFLFSQRISWGFWKNSEHFLAWWGCWICQENTRLRIWQIRSQMYKLFLFSWINVCNQGSYTLYFASTSPYDI